MKKHDRIIHQNHTLACDQCERTFSQNESLKNHKKSFHNGIKFNCKNCCKTFVDKNASKNHEEEHDLRENGLVLKCMECNAAFYNRRNFKRHVFKHHNGKTIEENIVLKENDNSPKTNNKTILGQIDHEPSTLQIPNSEQNVEDLSNSKKATNQTPIQSNSETTLHSKSKKSSSLFQKGKWIVELERINV